MTERVVPLSWHVKRRSLSEETCKWGLYTVAVCIMLTRDEAGILTVAGATVYSEIH